MGTRESVFANPGLAAAPARKSLLAGLISQLWSSPPKRARRARFEALEPRLLLSADTIVAGVTGALEQGLAGNPGDGFGDLLRDLIEGVDYLDNRVPGVRFDDVETGYANPTIREALGLDIDRDGDGVRVTDNTFLKPLVIGVLNLDPDIDIANVNDAAGIAAALPFIPGAWFGGADIDLEIALTLIDQDGSGRASVAEMFEVLVGGQIANFLDAFPGTKTVADDGNFTDLDSNPDVVGTTFSDLVDGYSDFGGPAHQGFTDFLTNLSEPSILGALVDLSTSGVGNTSDADFFSYDVVFNLTVKDDYLIDLGIAAESLEIDLPAESFASGASFDNDVKLLGSLVVPFSFAVERDGTPDYSFSVTDDLNIEVSVNESLFGRTVNVGFLGMVGAGGSMFELSLPFDVLLTDPSSPYHLGFGQADFAAGGDGELDFASGSIAATFAVDAADVILDQDVIFSLALGTQGTDSPAPVEVTVTAASTLNNLDGLPPTDHDARLNLVADINTALGAAGLGGILTAALNGGDFITLSLLASDATGFGFDGQEKFSAAGAMLTAENPVAVDFTLDDQPFSAAALISLGAAVPQLLSMSFTVSGANAAARRADFVSQAQVAIDAQFGAGAITVSLDGTDHVVLDPVAGADTLEITRSVTLAAEFEITTAELAAASFDELFATTPDAVNDVFEIDITLNAKSGIVVDGGGTLNGENINITADVMVDSGGGVITFPLQADLDEDFTGMQRFHLGDSLELSGTPFASFDPDADSFQKLLDFNVIGPAEVVNLIGQLKGWLNRLPNSEMLGGFDVPFAETTLGQLLDYADLIQDKLLLDDKDNGVEAFDDPELDDTGRLIDFIPSLDPGVRSVTFATAQELATEMNALPFVTVDGATAHYYLDPDYRDADLDDSETIDANNLELTYGLRVQDDFLVDSTFVTAPVDFELDLSPVFDVSAQAEALAAGSVALEATLGINLSASGKVSFSTPLGDLNHGDGVPIRTDLAMTGVDDVARISGRLSADAAFSVSVDGGAAKEVRVYKADGPAAFDGAAAVNPASDEVTLLGHGLRTGDAVVYDNGGDTDIVGLTDGATYFVIRVNADTIKLATSAANALAATPIAIDLTADGSGAAHTLLHPHNTDDNDTASNLLADINSALATAGLGTQIEAVEIAGRIVLQAKSGAGVDTFQVTASSSNPAFTELGLQSSGASTVFLTGVEIDASSLSGSASFGIELNNDGTVYTVELASLAGNNTLNDLVNDVNAALAQADDGGTPEDLTDRIVASRAGNRLVLAAVDASIDVFRISNDTDTAKLGLAASQLGNVQDGSTFLGQVAGVFVIGANFLDPAVNPSATIDSAFGRLAANASFNVKLNGAAGPDPTVTVTAASTAGNRELSDLIAQINTAIGGTALAGKILAVQLSASQIGLRAIDDSVIKIQLTSSAPELGLLSGQSADGPLRVASTKATPFYYGPGADASFTIDYTVGVDAHSQAITLASNQALTNRFIYDLVSDLNQSLNNAFGSAALNPFATDFDGNRLVIRAKASSGVTAFSISSATTGSAVTDLKLRDFELDIGATQTVNADRADLLIYTQDGEAHRVVLDGASDLQDVKDAIETATVTDVTVSLNDLQTGINLTDGSGTGLENVQVFRVESVNGSRAVFALGIQAADNSSVLADIGSLPVTVGSTEIDHVIEGDEVATLDLEDRLFVRQKDASTPFLTATVDVFVTLDSDDDVGEEESASYGFVGIELDTAGFLFDVLEFNVEIELNKDGDPLKNVTLAELVDAISTDVNGDGVLDVHDLNQVLTFPVMSEDIVLDELVFDVALLPGLAPGTITLGATPQITFDVDSAGDPFNMVPGTAPFDGSSGVVVNVTDNTITLTLHGFETGDKVSYRDFGGTSIGGLVDNKSYFVIRVDADTIQLAKTLSGALADTPVAVDLTSLGTGTAHRLLRFDPIAPDIEIHESDLGDLSNFAEIEFDHVLAALQQLRDFLNEFAELPFLGQEIPVLGVSFNDLIDVAGRFSDAVDDITNNPAGTIQQLAQKLRESFGLPPGASIIGLELVNDDDGADGETTDMLKLSLDLGRQFTEVLSLDLDLTDELPAAVTDLFPDLSLLGKAGLGAAIDLVAKLSVGIDLDDDGGGDSLGEVFLFTDEGDTNIAFLLDAISTDITFNASLGPLGVAIIGGDGKFDLSVGFKDAGAAPGDRVSIDDLTGVLAAFGAFDPSLAGSLIINLPVYFPSPSDFVGDILFDASLALSGTDQLLTVNNFEVPTDFLDAEFFENFGILTSLPLAIDALDLLLETVQDIMSGQIFGIPLPFIGDRLADGAEFIEDLRASVIAPFQNLVENTALTDEALADLIQQFLFAVMGPGGSGLGIPELASLPGLGFLIDPTDGLAATAGDFGHLDNIIDIVVDLDNSEVQWNFEVGDTYSPSLDFPFNIGFPGLGLNMKGGLGVELSWNFGLGLGISTEDGPFINIDRRNASDDPIPELSLSVDAGFQPGSELVGTLGFLQFSAAGSGVDLDGNGIDDLNHIHAEFSIDLVNGANALDSHLSFFELGDLDAIVDFNAGAELDLALRLAFDDKLLPDVISAILPALEAGFVFDWALTSPNILDEGFNFDIVDGLNVVKFVDVGLDLGSFLGDFLGPIVSQIQEFTDPLQPIVEILTARIPVLSDLAGKTVTLVDIAAAFGEFDPGFIYALADLVSFVNSIPADPDSIMLPIAHEFVLVGSGIFGDFKDKLADPTFDFADALNPESDAFIAGLADAFDSVSTVLDGLFNEAGEFVEGVFSGALGGAAGSGEAESAAGLFGGDFSSDERGGFAFPFLENPKSILGALLGNPIVLVTYDLPPLVVEFSWEQSFPIYGPLWGVIGAGLGVKIDLAFGYDTLGVQLFAEGGFENPLDLLSGLFISDTDHPDGSGTDVPELLLKGEISVGAELNVGVASAGILAAIMLTVGFDLNDPDSDGRVRISELVGNFLYELREGTAALAPLAIFDIEGEISFQLRAYLKILFAKFEFEITPPITLFEFAIEFDREPILATERGDGSLLLNIGPNAGARLHGNTDDIAETINVKQDGSKLLVWSDQFGVSEGAAQTYSGDSIVGFGGEFGDTIVIKSSVSVPVLLQGDSGDDTIEAEGTGGGELLGGVGDDEITGGSGVETIFGNEGNDTIDAAGGNDMVFGDDGRISDRLVAVLIREKDGDDVISGGAGNDTIFGAGGNDEIGGDNFVNLANPDDALTAGNDQIFGDGGRIVYMRDTDGDGDLDTLLTPEIRSTDAPGGGSDVIHAHGGVDTVYGGAGDDTVDGGAGNDTLYGESGFDYIAGGGDADTIRGGTEDDVIFGGRESSNALDPGNNAFAADGGDTIFGETGNDFIRGNNGNDIIAGGRGTDIIFGDFGDDTIAGEADNDYIFGGAGSDISIEGGTGNDIVFGDDGVVVFIDFGSLPFAGSFVGRLGHEIVSNDRLIGDGAFNAADPYLASDDGNYRTLDVIQTEVNGVTDGNDYVVGGEGDDIALGGAGGDTMFGDFDPANPPDGPIPADEDILIGDGGRIEFHSRERNNIRSLVGAALAEVGIDHVSGNGGNDVLFGNGRGDFLYGRMNATFNGDSALEEDPLVRDDDIIVADDGEIDYAAGTGIIQKIFSYFDAAAILVGGSDHAYGNKHDDIILGGIAGDFLKGDDGLDGDDVILGDNGEILYGLDDDGATTMIAQIKTTDTAEVSGGPDTIEGQDDDDVILGGVNNGSPDLLYGDRAITTPESVAADGQDIILGDNGILRFNVDGDLDTLDLISSEKLNHGGADTISGNAGDDVLIGSTGGDIMYGDDATASAGASDGEEIMLGDNGDITLIGTVGRLLVQVAGRETPTAVDLITTTDSAENTGGADTMSGNARADVMLGGVNDGGQDTLYGDRASPTLTSIANDGDDIQLGDNGLLDFTFETNTDRNTLDLIRSKEDALGGIDVISGNKGLDVGIGGTAGDTIYGDDASASAGVSDLGDLLLGDNADVFLVAAPVGSVPAVSDLKLVLRPATPDPLKPASAVKTIRTTDIVSPATTGGRDTISGNAKGDIIAGGVFGDTLYGDRAAPTPTTSADDGDDVILGDNGAFEWLSNGRFADVVGINIAANNPALYAKYGASAFDTYLTTLDLVTTEQPNSGGRDVIYGDEGDDLTFGGTDLDVIYGDDGDGLVEVGGSLNRDVLFGDHGRLYPQFSTLKLPLQHWQDALNSRNFFAIDVEDGDGGQGDVMRGEEGDDLMLGQQGDDRMWGGSGDDDMIGGHNVAEGYDELTAPAIVALLNPPVNQTMNDIMDGGSDDDAMAGDNAIVWRRGDDFSPRFLALASGETAMYETTATSIGLNLDSAPQSDPDDAVGRDIELLNHSFAVQGNPLGRFGADVMAGGSESDVMYGELGDDLMQGDGYIAADDGDGDTVTHEIAIADGGELPPDPDTGDTLFFNVPEADGDADDYMEGNGGNDLMYGGLGQDDMIGGSSGLFGLTTSDERPDGSDIMFGGAGIDIARNDLGDATLSPEDYDPDGVDDDIPDRTVIPVPGGHVRDADFIMGDNANVFRVVQGGASGVDPADLADNFRTFNYDSGYAPDALPSTYDRIIPRAMQQLDYTLGGGDFAGGGYNGFGQATPTDMPVDNGLADLIHGESGDDYIFGMTGSDLLFGEGQDDDIVGGYGHDWISGGTGQDGVIGDDGLLYSSRNSTLGEPLYGIAGLRASDGSTKYNNGDALNETISTPGDIQYALINVEGELKKTTDLVPFSFDPDWEGLDDEFAEDDSDTPFADDIIFGGLGSDFLHGGSGDDAISGAEALLAAFVPDYSDFDDDGDTTELLDLGYDAFTLTDPINPGDLPDLDLSPGDVLALNPQDVDGQHQNNRFRAGEFGLYDEYSPRHKILLNDDGSLWDPLTEAPPSNQFLLNFDKSEGVIRPAGTVPKATGQQTESYDAVNDDGKDAIFGDLGNDWLVGGTGRDNLYGGWGNDLLNADDDHETETEDVPEALDNESPDTHPFYEDRAYGGAGRDVLIGNTGGDRLIDWVGEYNSYLVPYAPYGEASVSRTMMPHLHEFLYALSAGDGADPTRFSDQNPGATPPAPTNNNPIPSRNGEPFGELGLVLQQDFAWGDQTGAPADPQAGNIPGGPRDVLRSAGLNDGTMEGFFVDSGKFAVAGGVLQVSAESLGGDAVSVFYVGDALPSYFEIQASISVIKPTAGWKANSYVIFDYQGEDDFKFAGIDASINKLVMGHRDADGWQMDQQAAVAGGVKADKTYNLLLAVNGVNVTLVVDNKNYFTYTYQPRVVDGWSYGLNDGMVGVGSDNSRGTFDNIRVLVLPPTITFQSTADFQDGIADLLPAALQTGTWVVSSKRYSGSPDGSGIATSLFDLGVGGLHVASYLELAATVNTATRAGFVFDRYSATDFKFVAIDAPADKVIIGHYTAHGGWVEDAVVAKTINAGVDYKLGVTVKGSTVSVTLAGQAVLGNVFNAVAVDGDFGLLAVGVPATFDDVTVKTDDAAFATSTGGNLLAAGGASAAGGGETVTQSQLDGAATMAIGDWIETLGGGDPRLASFGDMRITFADLAGDTLGYAQGRNVLIDRDAAGYGWSLGGFDGAGTRMDLVTVVTHELGHVLGFEHNSGHDVMGADLEPGAPRSIAQQSQAQAPLQYAADTAARGAIGLPAFDLDSGGVTAAGGSNVDWQAQAGDGWGVSYTPYGSDKPTKGKAGNFADYLVKVAGGTEQRAAASGFDSLGSALLKGGKQAKPGRWAA